ncbi:hypothetical protein [Brevibacterium album]|uniref:hypothetical protein n=1 Tax=Brevibacterium album TaxID=417948 RepID=UPI00040C3927|nr:hypothetical protein [Brevibacterium album]
MSSGLLVPADPAALGDWRTFVSRAQHADADTAIRLSVTGDVLVLTAAPLHPGGLGDSMPLVLGMRMLRLADSAHDGLDAVVEARALLDRFARLEAEAGGRAEKDGGAPAGVAVPPVEVSAVWAGIAPPRGPWEPVGSLGADLLTAAAEAGIAEVAEGTPAGAGAHAVDALRRQVWARTAAEVSADPGGASGAESTPVSAGAAFGAYVLGFLGGPGGAGGPAGEAQPPRQVRAQVLRCGVWTRLSLPGGHILTR